MSRFLALSLLACADGGSEPVEGSPPAPAPVRPDTAVVLEPQTGDPNLGSADAITFAAAGHLVVGDGAEDRLVVLQTDDFAADPAADDWERLPNLAKKVADALGAGEDDVEITDVAVNPLSGRTWVAAERQDTELVAIFTVEPDKGLALVDLAALPWVAVPYPEVDGAGSVVTDLEATSEALVAAVTEATWTSSQVVTVPLPVAHRGEAAVTSTRTYHRSHQQWETFAPITTLFSYEDGAETWIGASYQCAPVVRFPLSDLASGSAETVGTTPYDYGPLRQVVAFAVGGGEGDRRIYASVSNLGGTSVDQALFEEGEAVDEAAPVVFGADDAPTHDLSHSRSRLDDAEDIEVLDAERLVVWFEDDSLEILDQPK